MPIDSKKATTSLSWCEAFVEGADRPSSREGHTLSYFEGSLYLFGGRDAYCTTSELWQYHIEAAVWTKWVLGGTLPPRLEHHASLLYDRKMFLFGGSLLSDSVLWVFDFDLFEWNKYSFKKGEAPSNRHSHTLTGSSSSNIVYLYGGYTMLGLESDELWQYDIESNVWRQLSTEGPSPPPLCGHTAVLYGGLLWLMGGTSSRIIQEGLWCYDIELGSWRRIACTFHPPPLYRHVAVRAGDTMLVYGGTTDDLSSYKGLWRFNFEAEEWTQMISKELPAMSCHAGVVTFSQGTEHRISAHSGPKIEISRGGEQWTEESYITPNSSIHNNSRPQDMELSELRPTTTMSVVSKLSAASDEADTLPGMVSEDQGYRSHHASSSPPPVIPSVWENANVCDKFSPAVAAPGPGFCVTNPIFNNEPPDEPPTGGTRDSGRGSVNLESVRSTVSSGYNDNEQLDPKQQIGQIVFLPSDRDSRRDSYSGDDSGSQGSRSSLKKRKYKQCHSTTFYIAGHGPDAMSQSLVLYKCKIG